LACHRLIKVGRGALPDPHALVLNSHLEFRFLDRETDTDSGARPHFISVFDRIGTRLSDGSLQILDTLGRQMDDLPHGGDKIYDDFFKAQYTGNLEVKTIFPSHRFGLLSIFSCSLFTPFILPAPPQ